MRKFAIVNAVQDLGALMTGGLAVWIIGFAEGEVRGVDLGLVLRILCASILMIGLLWINVIAPEVRRRRAKSESEAYAQSFREGVERDAKRIDAMFGLR